MTAELRYGEYEVVAPLASGGMGGVYLAMHRTTGDRVALKVLDPVFANHTEVVERLYAEQAVSARASHPGLVEIRAASRSSDDIPFLVMEYLEGETLAALHAVGIAHCDVKPENLFVLHDGGVKVIDFGVSRHIDEPSHAESIAGTPAYMAPEQWKGAPELASDVYSLGCVMYELLTGDVPFDGSLPQLMMAHMEQRPARPSWLRAAVPVAIERLVMRALAKAPAMRPTMLEMARALGDLVDQREELPLRMAG